MNDFTDAKIKLTIEYLSKIDELLDGYSIGIYDSSTIFDLIYEIIKVYENEIPQLSNSILFRNGTETRDANTTKALLKMYLADKNIEYKETSNKFENQNVRFFWTSFILWFENELPSLNMLNNKFIGYSNWGEGHYYLNIDYDYEFKLRRGIDYPDSLKRNEANFSDIKLFLEIAYKNWIINDSKIHYEFTIEINNRFKIFKLPYRMQNGRVIKQGYRTTYAIDKILDYRMFERKIRFSEEMILSNELMEKKSALDFLIDALQYLISIQEGNRDKQYSSLAKNVNTECTSKVYSVVKQELKDLMKMSNEYFDIRHNDYLNDAKEKREALNDQQFIEYLYNRAYALLYILRLKNND